MASGTPHPRRINRGVAEGLRAPQPVPGSSPEFTLPYVLHRTYKEKGVSVSHFLGPRIVFPPHSHSYAQLTWPRAGRVRLRQGGEETVLGPGLIGLTDPWAPHALEVLGRPRADVVFLSVSRAHFQRLAVEVQEKIPRGRRVSSRSSVKISEATWHILSSLLQEAYAPGPASGALIRASAEQCVIALLRPPRATPRGTAVPRYDGRLSRALAHIEGHLDEGISLRQLAAIANLSPYHFARRFHLQYGMPPHRYLVHLRIKHAALLLQTTDLNVTEVALEVGYSNPGNFIRHFRDQFGTTPLAYRRRPGPAGFV